MKKVSEGLNWMNTGGHYIGAGMNYFDSTIDHQARGASTDHYDGGSTST